MLKPLVSIAVILLTLASCARLAAPATSVPVTANPGIDVDAERVCSDASSNVPNVRVEGPVQVAAAFATNGDKYAAFQEKLIAGMTSPWRDRPDVAVFVCYLDGDFQVTGPAPSGYDNSADRVIVSVSEGLTQLFYTSRTIEDLPLADPNEP
jgi:hypothetical protein